MHWVTRAAGMGIVRFERGMTQLALQDSASLDNKFFWQLVLIPGEPLPALHAGPQRVGQIMSGP